MIKVFDFCKKYKRKIDRVLFMFFFYVVLPACMAIGIQYKYGLFDAYIPLLTVYMFLTFLLGHCYDYIFRLEDEIEDLKKKIDEIERK